VITDNRGPFDPNGMNNALKPIAPIVEQEGGRFNAGDPARDPNSRPNPFKFELRTVISDFVAGGALAAV
jgi:hypothetical protein